jgi:peptidoglycan/LPS O-acetylase OafA/YrhL
MSQSSGRNEQLDGLRGYAALVVVFFHSILGADPTLIGRVLYRRYGEINGVGDWVAKIALTILNGETAVAIFFILSGAVLFETLQRDEGPLRVTLQKFFIRRFFRIYPALFVCVCLCWAAFNLFATPRSVSNLVTNLALYDFPINGATWTLAVEAWGAVLLALGFVAYRRFREAGLIVVALAFACLYLPPLDGHLVQFRMFIYCFALGALISTPLGETVIGRIPSAAWPFLLVGTIVARHTIQETMAAILIGLIYYRKAGAFGDFLARPISVFLGLMSYSLYLFNVLFLEVVFEQIRRVPELVAHPVPTGVVMGGVIVLLTLPVAYLSLTFVERPFIGIGRRLTPAIGKTGKGELAHGARV